eukprot:1537821-Prymnesium_polylepis.2
MKASTPRPSERDPSEIASLPRTAHTRREDSLWCSSPLRPAARKGSDAARLTSRKLRLFQTPR